MHHMSSHAKCKTIVKVDLQAGTLIEDHIRNIGECDAVSEVEKRHFVCLLKQ